MPARPAVRVDTSDGYTLHGVCPVCEGERAFTSASAWFRDHLACPACRSIPRERAIALVLNRDFPGWRGLRIHESSPEPRGVSAKMRKQGKAYVASQFFPEQPLGALVQGFRNENLEKLTFGDGSLDMTVSLDVMEHVNEPEACFREIHRTLVQGGVYLFTAPTHKELTTSRRVARFLPNGSVEEIEKPEYHGNPINPQGSIVTFRYGYDLPQLIAGWADFDVEVRRYNDLTHGIIGELTETYICRKR